MIRPGGRENGMDRTGPADGSQESDGEGRAERELDDALYHLRRGCEACAERHFDLARRYGATDEQIQAVTAAGSAHDR